MPTFPRLAMVAGEASGDLLAGLLMGGLKQRWPDASTYGIGGPRMAEHGFAAWWPHEKLAVRGYVEVLRHYREIAGIRSQLCERLLCDKPDAFIGVDAPDFNLGLEERLRAAGVRTIQFVCPSIWAWRGKRVHKIRRSADHVLCLFPFEPELLAGHGIEATYVGHPLADSIALDVPRAASREVLGIDLEAAVVALLPGSRRSEIQYNAPKIIAAAAELHRRRPGLNFLLPVVPGLRSMLEPLLAEYGAGSPIRLLDGRSHEVMAASDVVVIASGTATLEAALFKKPMVITYSMHWLSAMMMRRMGYLPWVGLPNILCKDFVVPELLQEAATPTTLADATLAWLDDPARCQALVGRFTELHQRLRCDTAQAATHAIAKVLQA
ncbi:lipid-A-disaccharide synthase [Schlegelella sp. S2-27]|uniref:Lipid-A-disaccharide synthase n=1 Tax=Caldimonas mangrovi TaxID=2944811 RepID=A0ABT0YQL9_9BURK|nr:lipid-A-disaccharide synthase [Caldimonas mangrovi]MCM5681037.1 lipid-A-disaccharide synthase [Caldimonas mangrovi]